MSFVGELIDPLLWFAPDFLSENVKKLSDNLYDADPFTEKEKNELISPVGNLRMHGRMVTIYDHWLLEPGKDVYWFLSEMAKMRIRYLLKRLSDIADLDVGDDREVPEASTVRCRKFPPQMIKLKRIEELMPSNSLETYSKQNEAINESRLLQEAESSKTYKPGLKLRKIEDLLPRNTSGGNFQNYPFNFESQTQEERVKDMQLSEMFQGNRLLNSTKEQMKQKRKSITLHHLKILFEEEITKDPSIAELRKRLHFKLMTYRPTKM